MQHIRGGFHGRSGKSGPQFVDQASRVPRWYLVRDTEPNEDVSVDTWVALHRRLLIVRVRARVSRMTRSPRAVTSGDERGSRLTNAELETYRTGVDRREKQNFFSGKLSE